jgi:hypothetical protein
LTARLSLFMALAVLGALLLAPAAADAQLPTKRMTQKVALQGKSKSGKSVRGTYTIGRFTRARGGRYRGRLVAVGTVRARRGGRRATKRRVVVPARLLTPAQTSQIPQPIPGTCQVLVLDLRPITLNVLGLLVRTSRIVVRIDAVPSTLPGGGLLGDLLCGITNLLNPQRASTGERAAALNAILALVPRQ